MIESTFQYCPNKDCGRPVPTSNSMIKATLTCPYCKTQFVDDHKKHVIFQEKQKPIKRLKRRNQT